mgnify:CR=1 FL=1|tara:strand:+ start:108 stop:1340 length:1233 start_codon:yes stop_codon:yes gene_type:complete
MSQPKTFAEAKALADQTYIQFLQDQQSGLSETDPEYAELQSLIEKGPLDFTSEETYDLLINTPMVKGGTMPTKKQYWINEDNPLRQAVEEQSEVMQNYLDEAGIPIVQKYGDMEGFDRPDSFRGEGFYLNTGTGAHIDWGSSLKRGQDYRSTPDSELGTYSQVFVRPDPSNFVDAIVAPIVSLAAPQFAPLLTAARGGDLGDIVKSYAVGELTGSLGGDFLEDTLANLGVDADLFGLDAETFTEGLGSVQEAMLEGGSGKEALLKEFGGEALDAVGIDLPEFELPETGIVEDVKELGRTVDDVFLQPFKEGVETVTAPIEDLSTPLKEAIETVGEPIVDVVDEVIDAVDSPIGDVLETAVSGLGGAGGMMSGASKPSQVEGLFDKELFKFDTEIKSTQRMLSPTNTRRYG